MRCVHSAPIGRVQCVYPTHRTDFPGGVIWWHDYKLAKRRGHPMCVCNDRRPSHVHITQHHHLSFDNAPVRYASGVHSWTAVICITHTGVVVCVCTWTFAPTQAMPSRSTSRCGTHGCPFRLERRRRTRARRLRHRGLRQ